MRIALVVYSGMNLVDLVSLAEPLRWLSRTGLADDLTIDLCAREPLRESHAGFDASSVRVADTLADYSVVALPGGAPEAATEAGADFIRWLSTAKNAELIAAVGSAAGLLTAAGFSLTQASNAAAGTDGQPGGQEFPAVWLARHSSEALALGLQLCVRLGGENARSRISQVWGGTPEVLPPAEKSTHRQARVTRETKETRISASLTLDGMGQADVRTGIPFLDHMLTQVAVHGLFDLDIRADGDLEIDPHHTLEDVALTLGKAFDQALGDRKGLVRMASAVVPMDESLAQVTLDFSGRPYAVTELSWNGAEVGGVPTTLFAHFLESFAAQARCNLHARLLAGADDHHRAEAVFKALGRALDAATQIDPRRAGTLPSSKGAL